MNEENYKNVDTVLTHMALCHNVIYDAKKEKFNSQSPDELALVNGAKFLGVAYDKRDDDNNIIITHKLEGDKEKKYK
jgi:magnesium-transporting ATPase (P-type)